MITNKPRQGTCSGEEGTENTKYKRLKGRTFMKGIKQETEM
jgi:hypothetical protein